MFLTTTVQAKSGVFTPLLGMEHSLSLSPIKSSAQQLLAVAVAEVRTSTLAQTQEQVAAAVEDRRSMTLQFLPWAVLR
jgi:hypothetical protein